MSSQLPPSSQRTSSSQQSSSLQPASSSQSSIAAAAQSPDERFDVVDEHDRVVRQATRAEVHKHGLLHRAVHAWVVRSDGRLVLQMRSAAKDQHPLTWTSSASGHVDAGETYAAAIEREVQEELGLPAAIAANLRPLARFAACTELGNEFTELFFVQYDGPLSPAPAEIERLEARSLTAWNDAVAELPKTFSPSLRFLLEHAGPTVDAMTARRSSTHRPPNE